MDIAAMKQDFYKRFEESGSYLKQEKCGLLCTLLGFPDIEGALSLTYPLSVGVTGLCRPSNSDKLQLENTDSDTVYTPVSYTHLDVYKRQPSIGLHTLSPAYCLLFMPVISQSVEFFLVVYVTSAPLE